MRRRTPWTKRNEQGIALLTALVFIAIAGIILIALMGRHTQQRLDVDNFETYCRLFEAAEAAMQQCEVEAESGLAGIIGLEDWEPEFNEYGQLTLPDFDRDDVAPATLMTMPGIAFIGFTYSWFGDGRDSNGDGMVDSPAERGMLSIHTAAMSDNWVRQLEAIYTSVDVNVWNNAIFAGSGQAGGVISGNVRIHGSVHLLGDHLVPGATAVEATEAMEMSGSALLANNYEGMPALLKTRVPPLPTVMYNGEEVATLNATLRVKRGLVGINGTAQIGAPWVPGSGVKGPMDGTYVNDGWTGNQVTDDGYRGIPSPSNYYSDNGYHEGYDLSGQVPMPLLQDDWREPDGSRIMNPYTGAWYTHEEYFSEVLLANPNIRNDGIFTGNLVLNAWDRKPSDAIYWNASTQQYLTGDAARAATPGVNDDYMKFDPVANLLLLNGQIRINGSILFTGKGYDTIINYSGRGSLLVNGPVTLDSCLIACNNGNPSDITNCFPQRNVIGIMATGDMLLGTLSQTNIMGAFYAQGKITSQKQTNIVGALVGNFFDMGSQVPSIFQVPSLASNLPYGMIGNYPIMVLSRESWREVGI